MKSRHNNQGVALSPLLLCLWVWLGCLSASAVDTRFYHQIWQPEEGLPGPVVRSILQTRNGYLWVATAEGLARFDGVRFTAIDPATKTSERDRQYFALTETSDGSLWTSTSNGLLRIQGEQKTYYTASDGLPGQFVLTVYEDRKKQIWIGSTNGLARFDQGKFVRYTSRDGFKENAAVRSILEDQSGILWVGTAKGLTSFKDGQVQHYSTNGVHCVCQASDGALWVGTTWGLDCFREGVWTHYGEADGLAHRTVWSVYEDSFQNLWIGGFGKGVQLFADGKFATVNIDGELASDFDNVVPGYTFAITGDREGDIWIGTSAGLNRLRRQSFRTFRKAQGLAESVTTSVCESRDGCIWVGTWGGGVSQITPDHQIINWGTHKGLPTRVLGIWEDRSGALWIGSESSGLFRMKDGELQVYREKDGLIETGIKTVFEDSAGTLWIGGQDGLSYFREGTFHPCSREIKTVKVVIESKQGGIWVGHLGGLARIVQDSVRFYDSEVGFPGGMVNALYEDQNGTLWVGTEQGELLCFKNNQFTTFPTAQTFNRVLHILEDDAENLWMSSRNGIFRLSKKELNEYASGAASTINSVAYGKLDGMRRAQCNGIAQPAGWKASDGRIWFPTLAGIVAIDRKNAQINRVPPPVFIEEVRVAGQLVPNTGKKPTFPAGAKDIEFKYTALSLQVPEKVMFKYQLDGFDYKWGAPTTERVARYPHLPPGNYVFRLKACNNEGVWNEAGARYEFSLPPQFHETGSFYGGCGLFAVVSGLGIYRWRMRRLQQREDQLRAEIDERTRTLQQEVADRKQAEQALVESQEMVLRQERLAAVGQLAAGVAHEFNNVLTVIQGHTEMLLQKPRLDEDAIRSLKHISSGVDRTTKLTQQMLAFSRKQIMQQEVLDLNAVVRQVTEILDRLLTENIALNCDFDPDLPTVEADAGMVEQIVMNLAVNARDAMPKGGELRIRTQGVILTEASIAEHPEGREGVFVCVSVADTGCGMDAGTINRIFEPFFTTKDVGKGTGLGLATVYGVVKQHQGWIEVSSQIGKGTTFSVYLPASGRPLAKTAKRPSLHEVPGGGETILAVEDELVLQELITEILRGHGYHVLQASNAIEALSIWERCGGKVDLVLTDMVMPEGLSGRELADKLREQRPNLPIIFSSGYSQEFLEQSVDPQPGIAILSKPYHPAELVRLVRSCLDRAKS